MFAKCTDCRFERDLAMTPYESLLWNAWLPKVRSCIKYAYHHIHSVPNLMRSCSNEWSPLDPNPALRLYEAWSNFLPPFIRDNIIDQLIIPKVQKATAEWQPQAGGPALRAIVFPWLPHVGLRIEEFLGDAKRKVKSILRNWMASDCMPEDLLSWKDVSDDESELPQDLTFCF